MFKFHIKFNLMLKGVWKITSTFLPRSVIIMHKNQTRNIFFSNFFLSLNHSDRWLHVLLIINENYNNHKTRDELSWIKNKFHDKFWLTSVAKLPPRVIMHHVVTQVRSVLEGRGVPLNAKRCETLKGTLQATRPDTAEMDRGIVFGIVVIQVIASSRYTNYNRKQNHRQ